MILRPYLDLARKTAKIDYQHLPQTRYVEWKLRKDYCADW